jgi:glutaredoxin
VHQVVLFSRAGCHLCDLARETIGAVRAEHDFDLEEIDIETEDRLVRDYGLRVPVVAVDGEEVFEIEVDPARLRSLVRS